MPGFLRWGLSAGTVAGPVFVLAFLVQGAVRPDYQPLRQPVSSLALGPYGWIQAVSFIATGILVLAFAAALGPAVRNALGGRVSTPAMIVLVGLVGIGLVGAGLFTTDPMGGYPPGTPVIVLAPTPRGTAHNLFSTPVFTALPAAAGVMSYRFHRSGRSSMAMFSTAAAILFVAAFVLTSVGFSGWPPLAPIGGLLQRLTLIIGFGWLTVLAATLINDQRDRHRAAAAENDVRHR